MNQADRQESLHDCLVAFAPTRFAVTRSLALFSAAITDATTTNLQTAISVGVNHQVSSEQLYEAVLQSYLFLGYPRMLMAAEELAASEGVDWPTRRPLEMDPGGSVQWFERGQKLCRRVYDSSYEALRTRVQSISPEIFLWMELEGYGKVLSRSGLDIIDREMCIVACLMMENRRSQLHSHLRGALNVGAEPTLVKDVVADLASASPEGHATALSIFDQLGVG